jgi:Tn7-like transposition protein D
VSLIMESLLWNTENQYSNYNIPYYKNEAFKHYAKGSQLKISQLIADLNSYFGLQTIQTYQNAQLWPSQALFNSSLLSKDRIANPLLNILLFDFFSNKSIHSKSVSLTIDQSTKCINPCATHPEKHRTPLKRVVQSNKIGKSYASYHCSCGMKWIIYLEKDGSKGSQKITEYGEKWLTTLLSLIKKGNAAESIAKQLNVSIDYVLNEIKFKSRLELRVKANQNQAKRKIEKFTFKLNTYRKTWRDAIKVMHNQKIVDVIKEFATEYFWLLRNDGAWLRNINSKTANKASIVRAKHDYSALDLELSKKISTTYLELVKAKYRYRISRTSLLRGIITDYSRHVLSHLPKTNQLLAKYIENYDDKRLRLRLKN